MRICMVASSYPRFPGDIAGTFIQSLADELHALDHHVGVVAPHDPAAVSETLGPTPVRRFPYSPFANLQPMGYGKALTDDQHLRRSAYALAAPYLVSGAAVTARAAIDWHSDVIHAHWLLPNGPIGVAAARVTGKPLVVTLHGSDIYLAQRNPILRWIARRTLRSARVVTACSLDLLDSAQALGARPESLRLIPWGGDATRFSCGDGAAYRERLGIDRDAPVVLGVGRMVEKKGFSYLLEAFQLLLAEGEDTQPQPVLVMAGDGPQRAVLEASARTMGIAGSVRFPGNVPWPDMPHLMAMADVVAVPSVRDSAGNQDGLPTVALEAMAAGKPVIASALGGLPLVVEHGKTGLLVPPSDAPSLAQAIATLLDAPETVELFGAAGRARVQGELSWRSIAERYASVYREAMSLP